MVCRLRWRCGKWGIWLDGKRIRASYELSGRDETQNLEGREGETEKRKKGEKGRRLGKQDGREVIVCESLKM